MSDLCNTHSLEGASQASSPCFDISSGTEVHFYCVVVVVLDLEHRADRADSKGNKQLYRLLLHRGSHFEN